MVKKFSTEFKQQSVDYALSNAHLSLVEIANHLGIGKSTLDKWIRQINPDKTSKRELTAEQQKIIALEKENKELKMANEILKKGACVLHQPSKSVKYKYMKQHFASYPMPLVCRQLNVSVSGYYAWLRREPKSNALFDNIKALYWWHKARLGAPSLVHDIRDKGYDVSERTVSRVLQKLGLRSKAARKCHYRAAPNQSHDVAPNTLDRQFNPDKPNLVWVTDITYIKTGEGWLYLCVIIDLFGRKVIGRQTSHRIDRHLVCNTLKNALFRRQFPKGVLLHSDRGSQYCSGDFKRLVLRHGLSQSMSRAGNCWDNAVAESFFHTLKTHIIHDCDYKTREDANKALFEYIEIYYNRVRRHSTNGWISPEQYEKQYYLNNTFIEASTV
ncbi:IS3 family transposase [Orbus sturtevantii]|uniref:IS3 family transposase n=2 Tax=Orbus sturtevantii TaxID=3074109 RepID=UPI00370DA719